MYRILALFSLLSLLLAATLGMPATSGATYVATSSATASVQASSDWTPPTATLADPGSPVKDTVTLTATASDGESGIASVVFEALPNGGAWSTLCTVTTAPYTCSWNTKLVADGGWTIRARAMDNAGYASTWSSVSTVVANNLLVVLDNPGDTLRGTVPLAARVYNSGVLSLTTRIEYSVAGADNWKTACSGLGSTLSCSWASIGVTSQDYDFRAVAVVGVTTYASAVWTDVTVDNVAPTVTMTDPGTPLRGTVTLAATAADAGSGLASVTFQYALSGSSTWTPACTSGDTATCRFATTALADATYSFRAVAADLAGNTATSATIANRVVDNSVTSVSVEDPGAFLTGTVTVNANASSTGGIVNVVIQRAPAGGSTWTDLCTDTTSPYSCSWNTTGVADGLYDLRAVALDGRGATTISSVVSSRRVDNSPFRAYDVQAVNGGASAGKLDAGDQLQLTYSSLLQTTSISAGWNGSALAVQLRLRDGNVLGLGNKGDTLDVLRSGSVLPLGSVNLKEEYAKSGKTITFNATMTAVQVTVNGAPATQVVVTLGSVASGTGLRGGNPSAMVWTPSTAATSATGAACAGMPATETGTVDRDF
ncbi:Ig-like domain-containing protein [Nocardioides jiangxiensis]|uniref:Ig-like domain-containing protein n=1 Tax=Nocardioides jiangxiensis TaxID=3064524 RepID=A0ABT9AYI5_9ACTN|nr:Ig-like domain-containing protein [Nocardioides sp. WY-20]MDO7867635.1 Ig-like domain-containing protein [Nocardioides sp. WY-20]